jgi:hypothetical protein
LAERGGELPDVFQILAGQIEAPGLGTCLYAETIPNGDPPDIRQKPEAAIIWATLRREDSILRSCWTR